MAVSRNTSKYIDPFTDTGFKIIFGTEGQSEELLVAFLNELFRDQLYFDPIESLSYINSERARKGPEGKTIIHDVICNTAGGHRFILEMQRGRKDDFVSRSVYYTCRGITDQISISHDKRSTGYWYMPVTSVFLCDFRIRDLDNKLVSHFMLRDMETGTVLQAGLRMAYVQLTLFDKEWEECTTDFDKWIYLLKNMNKLKEFPKMTRKDEVFARLESVANYAALSYEDQVAYEADVRWASEYEEVLATARREAAEEGRAEGRAEGIAEGITEGRAQGITEGRAEGEIAQAWKTAEKMWKKGYSVKEIAEVNDLPLEEVKLKFIKQD